ncbi:MAG: GerA spore germination protein [Paenibacillus sp.]|nr:GerA spore germination protein [Paenibacillus sp.]
MAPFSWSRKKKVVRRRSYQKASSQSDESTASGQSNSNKKNDNSKEINTSIEDTIEYISQLLGENDDFVVRRFKVMGSASAVVVFFSHMTNNTQQEVLKPLMTIGSRREQAPLEGDELRDMLLNDFLYPSDGVTEKKWSMLVEGILGGRTIIHVEGMEEAFMFDTRNIDKRAIDQPQTEQVIRGPREGFIEVLCTNIALMRYRLQTPDFIVKTIKLGKLTRSDVAICYINGIVNPSLVEEVNRRLSIIEIDGIMDSGYLEQFIQDNHFTPFPQIQNTERPDKAVANLIEGRVVLLVEGSPIALILPSVFTQFYQTAEDYNERFLLMSFIRLARLLALVFSLIFPSLYVAIISFNPELIPTEFAVAVSGGRAGVPFPSVIEVLIMEVSMEVLREATIRLPQQVGGALSIVGVLVVGQAAVSAGFVSPITVVVIALTTIGSFATPAYNAALALRLLRFPLIIISGVFGLYGVMLGLILIVNHMLSLQSFGVPYLSPIVPGNFQGMKDTLIRSPLWWLKRRPTMLHTMEDTTVAEDQYENMRDAKKNVLEPKGDSTTVGGDKNGKASSNNGDSDGGHHI